VREDIIVALTYLLKKAPNVKLVTREFTPIDSISSQQFPAIIIEDDGPEEFFDKTGGFADVSFIVNIIGYVNQGNVSTGLNKLDTDLKKTIASNLTLDGKVATMRILPYTDRSGTQAAPYGFFSRPLRITYEGNLAGGL